MVVVPVEKGLVGRVQVPVVVEPVHKAGRLVDLQAGDRVEVKVNVARAPKEVRVAVRVDQKVGRVAEVLEGPADQVDPAHLILRGC